MSFAYIDSQGKEVSIPGPDALRLRIELGAITDTTQFYDAGSDRWAPAADHEIYRQLKRDLSASRSGGFMAPPPSAIDLDGPVDVPDLEVTSDPEPEAVVDLPDADAFEPWDPEPGENDAIAQDLDEIVASGADDDPSHEELFYPQGATADELNDGMDGFTLADLDAPVIVDDDALDGGTSDADGSFAGLDEEPEELGADSDEDAGEDFHEAAASGGFDFGGDALELDVEEEDDDEPDEAAAAAAAAAELEGLAPRVAEDDTPDFGMAFEGGAPDDDFADDDALPEVDEAEVESEADAAEDPHESEPAAAADSAAARAGDPYRREIRERRGPRSKPPKRAGEGAGAGRMVAVVVGLIVIAGGAWFLTRGSGDGPSAPETVVVLPDLPAELEPQLRDVGRIAAQLTVAEFDSLPQRLALEPEPAERWLSGAYLSNASAYPGVAEYWEGVGGLVDAMIERGDGLWEASVDQALDSAGVAASARAQIRNRALAGWAAAEPDRAVVHEELRGVVDASLELHEFLLRNEASITFAPGTGGAAGDPVLEAVPDTPELGDTMWDLVGDITIALDALGYLQQVETASLMDRVKAKLAASAFR